MTPQDKARQQAEVMIAFAEGKTIEYRENGEHVWEYAKTPSWDWFSFDYRIKPAEPKKVKLTAFTTANGQLLYFDMMRVKTWNSDWTRVPSLDLEYEVTE